MQSFDTVDYISVNRQRQVPRTGTAQWQVLEMSVVTQQKVQKKVEILQVQFIDKVIEISEIMQSKDQCHRSRRNGNSREFTDRIVDVPVVLKRQCQPNAQVLDRIPTTVAKDATMQKDPNVSPQSNQMLSAKTRLTMSSHERQPTKRRQECLKQERERVIRLHHVWTGRSVHTCLSRGVPADHEEQSQVKEEEEEACRSEGAQRKPHPTERRPQNKKRYRRIHNRGDARVQE